MKLGVFHLVWAPPLSDEALPSLAERARSVGAEAVEIAISRDPLPFTPSVARSVFDDHGLALSLVTSLNAHQDVASPDPVVSMAGRTFLRRYVDFAAELGSPLLSGALYGVVWQPTLLSADERARRWASCVEAYADLGAHARAAGVRIALEPLSRFHTSFLNTIADARRLVDDIDSPAVGILFDTFQMNIEEKDLGRAIRLAGDRLFHVHASENDRGTPGSGHIDWTGVRDALRDVAYDERVIIEAFNPDNPDLANFLKVWRRLEPDQDTLARDGLAFLKRLLRGGALPA